MSPLRTKQGVRLAVTRQLTCHGCFEQNHDNQNLVDLDLLKFFLDSLFQAHDRTTLLIGGVRIPHKSVGFEMAVTDAYSRAQLPESISSLNLIQFIPATS